MAVTRIDLNADLAEECGDDSAMYQYLSSANICCGQHAGSREVMRDAVSAAVSHGVVIGAHVGYADRDNFGRIDVELSYRELYDLTALQLHELKSIVDIEAAAIAYVKPHGALYHRVGSDKEQARAMVDAVADFDSSLEVLVPNTAIIKDALTSRNVSFAHEFFADRAYLPNGTLAPRSMPNSLLEDAEVIATRVLLWLETGTVIDTEGNSLIVEAESICLHGDTAGAIESAARIHESLVNNGVIISSWMTK